MRRFARHKFLFDMGTTMTSQLVGIFNTCLLLIAVGDKVRAKLGVSHTGWLILGAVATYLIGTWCVGYAMDRSNYILHLTHEHNRRNPVMKKLQEDQDAASTS